MDVDLWCCAQGDEQVNVPTDTLTSGSEQSGTHPCCPRAPASPPLCQGWESCSAAVRVSASPSDHGSLQNLGREKFLKGAFTPFSSSRLEGVPKSSFSVGSVFFSSTPWLILVPKPDGHFSGT